MRKEVKKGDILKRPEYPGGQKALRAFITSELRYPAGALEAGIEGTVYLRYAIDHQGVVGNVKVLRSLGHGCDEEAVRLVRLLHFHVEKTRGVKVLYHKNIQIHFRLPVPAPAPPYSPMEVQYHVRPTAPPSQPVEKEETKKRPPIQITITFGD